MGLLNRLGTSKNGYQGEYKKVLCVCSAGLLRSPTAALVLSQEPFNFNTRAAGVTTEYALIPVDHVLLHWADEVVCMEDEHAAKVKEILTENKFERPIVILGLPDQYEYRNDVLKTEIAKRYAEALK